MPKQLGRLRSLILVSTLLLAAIAGAQAQCDHPRTDAQRAQCLGDELKGADRTINRVYGELMKSLSPADRVNLRDEQRTWLKERDQACKLTWSKGDRDAWLSDLLRDYQKTVCVVRLTNDRVQVLNNYQSTNRMQKQPAAGTGQNSGEPIYDIETAEARTKGKWYFEIKVDPAGIQRLGETALFAGVIQSVPEENASNQNGQSTGTLLTIRRIDRDLERLTLGFAVDLDNGKLYMSTNGKWSDGSPGSSGGQDLLRGRSYKAMLTSSIAINPFLSAHALEINFGGKDFSYHIPEGYRPLQEQ
jgi:uncharacterized protein YecT (DUF1311 family)